MDTLRSIDWAQGRWQSLHRQVAAVAQEELEDSLTAAGAVADAGHFGHRIATVVLTELRLAGALVASGSTAGNFCARCGADEGKTHTHGPAGCDPGTVVQYAQRRRETA